MSVEHLNEIPLEATYLTPNISNTECERIYRERYEQVGRLIYIYTRVKERYQYYQTIINIINLILSSTITVLTVLTFNFNCNISIGMNVAITVCSLMLTITGGINTIFDLSGKITRYQQYLDRTNEFFAMMMAELNVPEENTYDRKKFLLSTRDRYVSVIQSVPETPTWLYVRAHKEYVDSQKLFSDKFSNV